MEKLTSFWDSVAVEIMKDHEKRFADRIRTVRDASNALANSASRFGSSVKSSWGSMDETASEYGMRLAQSTQEIASQIAKQETSSKFSDAENFHEESVQALNKIIVTVRRYVPKLHRGLKTETAALNTSLVRLENSIRMLGTALDESPGAKIDSARRDAEALARRYSELLALKNEEAELTSALKEISSREEDLVREEQGLISHGEFIELIRYEESLRTKEDEIKQFLQPVVKPLLKLERIASNNRNLTVDINMLHGLVEDPVETVATGQSFSISKLLDQLDDSLGAGQLDVEERRRRKAQDTIQQVRDGAMTAKRDEYLATQANVRETLRQLRSNGLLEKRDKLEERLVLLRRDKEASAARHRDLQRRIEDASKELLKQKTALESRISKLSHRPITVLAG